MVDGEKCSLGARALWGKLPPQTSLVSPSGAPFQDSEWWMVPIVTIDRDIFNCNCSRQMTKASMIRAILA